MNQTQNKKVMRFAYPPLSYGIQERMKWLFPSVTSNGVIPPVQMKPKPWKRPKTHWRKP